MFNSIWHPVNTLWLLISRVLLLLLLSPAPGGCDTIFSSCGLQTGAGPQPSGHVRRRVGIWTSSVSRPQWERQWVLSLWYQLLGLPQGSTLHKSAMISFSKDSDGLFFPSPAILIPSLSWTWALWVVNTLIVASANAYWSCYPCTYIPGSVF